jgi:hypothetical protein
VSALALIVVKKQFALLVVGLVSVLVVAGQLARAANAPALRNDSDPYWSQDAREIAFDLGGHIAAAVPPGHGAVSVITQGLVRGWRPGGAELVVEINAGTFVMTADGRFIGGLNGTVATWSPDGGRIAYLRDGFLYASDSSSAHEHQLLGPVARPSWDSAGPVWSPDGKEIALATTEGLRIVESDGSGSHIAFAGANQSVNPSWSPDGATIAFERNDGPHWVIWFVDPSGENPHAVTPPGSDSRFPQWSPVSDRYVFISDRQHVPGGATSFQYALYLQSPDVGKPAKLLDDVQPVTPARWSPTAVQIAVAAGQECRRWGIYVVEPSAPGRAHRRSNLCRFEGTPGDDNLTGTPYFDVMRGFDGNDTISGDAGNDHIEGNGGNDTIAAGSGDNAVFGGPGNDTIRTGSGRDLIEGGPGRDSISAGGGDDRIEARDGFRDVIDCGPGNDTAEIDRLDVVRNCEHVLKP